MPYDTKESLRHDLMRLGVTTWDGAPASPGQSALDEIAECCWTAYQKSYRGTGDLVIGRQKNLSQAGLYEKVADMQEGQTLFDKVAKGNLLKMDKWAKVVNDAWILGGVHRYALVRLASRRVMDNLWNKTEHYYVVTAREILGFLAFGYEFEQVGPWQCLVCEDQVRAKAADLIAYDELVKSGETIEKAKALEDREGSTARVQKQILSFRH